MTRLPAGSARRASGSLSNWLLSSSGSAMSTGRRVAIARVMTLGVSSVSRTPGPVGPGGGEPGPVDHAQAELVVIEERHRRAQRADRGPAHLGDHLDHLLHVERLGQHRRRLLQPRGAQRRRRQLVGQPAAHLLGLALAGHVGAGADPLGDLPVPLDRHRPHVVVPVGAAPGAHPEPVIEDPAGAQALPPVPLDPLAVLRVDRVEPPVAEELLDGLPGDPPPLGGVLEHLAVRRRHPDDLRAALDERPVPLLAAAQRLLGGRASAAGDDDEPGAAQRVVRTAHAEPVECPLAWRRRVTGRGPPRRSRMSRSPGGPARAPAARAASPLAASTAGQTAAMGCPVKSLTWRSYILASAGLTQTNRKSVSRNAIPAGASRSTASGSQDSNSPNPASRCFGTEVSALNRAPHPPCRRLPLAAPSWRQPAGSATSVPRPQRPLRISVPQSRYRCCQLAAWKPSANRCRRGRPPPEGPRKRDTNGLAAIARHNDGSMGKFSYSG